MENFTHFDETGKTRMVDVTEKAPTLRVAVAKGRVRMLPDTLARVLAGEMPKGAVFETARIAGIMAAKGTASLIPLCHPLNLSSVEIDFEPDTAKSTVTVISKVKLKGVTGVEMEALTAVSVACLTIYDMCKAVDKGMVITDIHLEEKIGGKSGRYRASKI